MILEIIIEISTLALIIQEFHLMALKNTKLKSLKSNINSKKDKVVSKVYRKLKESTLNLNLNRIRIMNRFEFYPKLLLHALIKIHQNLIFIVTMD